MFSPQFLFLRELTLPMAVDSLTGTEKAEKMMDDCDTGSSNSNMSLKSGRFVRA